MSGDAPQQPPPDSDEPHPGAPLSVVGIGAGGWDGLSPRARTEIAAAEVLFGSDRQLALLPAEVTGHRVAWPRPLLPALPELLDTYARQRRCVLASGDPMSYGIGATLARLVGPDRLRVIPHPSASSLACARMGWPSDEVTVVSAVARPLDALRRLLAPGQRLLVLSEGPTTPGAVAALLREAGFAHSQMTVLADLDGPEEYRRQATAADWTDSREHPLNVVAVECAASGAPAYSTLAGLPDDAYDHDGQLTKREVRALTLARLAPLPGQLLWDVGAGSGSVAIEWMRSHATCRAVALERDPGRAERIRHNAARLGVPGLETHTGEAPGGLCGLPAPDAIFVGGGASDPEVLSACWAALPSGARMVVNAVTLAAEACVLDAQRRLGGELTRLEVQRAGSIGQAGHAVWRPALPITQWTVDKT
ncbi:precorrin-6y C5,15-methyltransferase (decarboxylating) subunit CbiE [Lipingzhangella sp. LS1_29]|uniref:Precorrin-6y C5,15-methyltransferase (Decarboxylating) subunit CbiE n=1 Tax=Lipingzhangella rawalii TaxID=2055835 RepID=A0ABU2H6T0_9ACTN|nr:precorrin-6y C5,15-methyltransferase (decarboxylating) subunit CbiE [Lipingzhangella rawalii]MDS1271012.1 precorrin-6y C5,15-methyltransferase (decarboxylating) subunit CbiE [Lipingzhangella rawalii]